MANEEQLALLNAGVGGWNIWRKVNPNAQIDLTSAPLSGADLSGANLSGAIR